MYFLQKRSKKLCTYALLLCSTCIHSTKGEWKVYWVPKLKYFREYCSLCTTTKYFYYATTAKYYIIHPFNSTVFLFQKQSVCPIHSELKLPSTTYYYLNSNAFHISHLYFFSLFLSFSFFWVTTAHRGCKCRWNSNVQKFHSFYYISSIHFLYIAKI